MKYQSKIDKNIFFEDLHDTPISYLDPLWLVSIFYWDMSVYFFFEGWKKNKTRRSRINYYLKINGRNAYRVMQEQEAYSSVWKYFSSHEYALRSDKRFCRICRLYGTPYIEEMNKSGIYSDYKEDVQNKVFQIMVITEDETIEIVNPLEMEWVKYDHRKTRETIVDIFKKKK